MNKTIKINGRKIGSGLAPYIIAEMSANHNGSIDSALEILAQAKKSGADAVKIQTYTPDTLTLKSDLPDFQITDGLWKGKSLYELYEWAHTPWDWHGQLFEKARELEITIFSSPFDSTAVDLLEDLNAPAYKIASFEVIDLPLIEYVASTKKPMIMSTGMANATEIEEAVDTALSSGCEELALLHCVSAYPAAAGDYNLTTLIDMQNRFSHLVGLSDHTPDNTTAIVAVALGASIIEKHVTLDKFGGGPDDSFSITFSDLSNLVTQSRMAWLAMGKPTYERQAVERGSLKFRRSLYFAKDLPKGTTITDEDVKSVRPGYGIAPKHYNDVLGKKLKNDVSFGTRVEFDLLEN